MKNEQIVLAKRPEGVPGDDVFRFEEVEVEQPSSGEVLVKPLYISVDPYMRGRMSDAKSYVAPYELDKPLQGHIVGEIVESKDDAFKEGDHVVGVLPWQRYITVTTDRISKIQNTDVPLHLYLSTLGMTGQTAYHGLLKIGQPKEGETVVVSAASGAVGSVVGQIAKLKGARVVGIAGGEEKVNYLTETLGFDAGVDYKADDFEESFKTAVPDGVDVYFENVGGEVSDVVLKQLNTFARVPVCGTISSYNNREEDIGPRIQGILVKTQALMQGFIVGNYSDDFEAAGKELAEWVQNDRIHTEVSIEEGFENVPKAFRYLFEGKNFGKQVVKV
ncbi:NADP-dependent oxidoreductase [Salinicoccus hispanicus]|uniref:Zinc-binding dehydrogenase n=1 Tax=Salinicoccus hispanicus TaxID=157225 RepID=A0A6N8U7P1_9STAP|nr:NADP-dependent oxidoreductase [Salinicoccus hispanicus]MXQ51669.1 zinc-binding dehydrogenase [Salinicoccus hispanicus]